MASAGPPKFRALKRTTVTFDAKVEPTEAALTEDFSKIRSIAFTGQPPEPLVNVAPLPIQEARIAKVNTVVAEIEGKPRISLKQKRTSAIIDLDNLAGLDAAAAAIEEVDEGEERAVDEGEEGAVAEGAVAEGAVAEAVAVAIPGITDPVLLQTIQHVKDKIAASTNMVTPPFYIPENNKTFKNFLIKTFIKYILPPQTEDPDPEACQKVAKASSKEIKNFQYQEFIRDYLQRSSPYRGLLVFHGLGSGKTCTSIATAEALYGAGNRKIIIMTPASLSGNFRGEMTKCGYFAFQQENHWTFVNALVKAPGPELIFLTDTLGLPIDWIRKIKGGWVPDPKLPSNWKSLPAPEQAQINEQITRHIGSRFQFINYNGLTENRVREWACKTPRMFDGAVIIIDEIHNLIRTINNSDLENFYKQEPLEPEYTAKFCLTGRKYRIGYLVYRLLCNAVGAKIVALSGTPIINYPQELGILANLLSGDMRYASSPIPTTVDVPTLSAFLNKHPEVDLCEVLPGSVKLTPVPSGYRKVIDPATGKMRGFVRDEDLASAVPEIKRERDLVAWMARIEKELKTVIKGTAVVFTDIKYGINQRLPDIEKTFIDTFIDTESLTLKKPNDIVLQARLSGLISYYKAGKPEMVARVVKDEVVEVEMSDKQLQQYTIVRNTEIKQEEDDRKKAPKKAPAGAAYAEVIKNQKGTFKIFSRATCNFSFPDEIPRPRPGDEKAAEADLGIAKDDDDNIISEADQAEDEAKKKQAPALAPSKVSDHYQMAIRSTLVSLRQRGADFFSKENLSTYSPKFQAIINNLETSKGPALLYSVFKTLEGLGIFGMALEFQKNYIKLDIVLSGGQWSLAPELLLDENKAKKRYITYTGDEDSVKRDMLKHIFNANWAKIPPALTAQVKQISGDAINNIHGEIAQLFMITQSGAEGISLESVRQVHLMEPYWNYVRLEQVRGRAIRICSHKSLPFEERTVEVFTYISKFSEAQKTEKRIDQTLLIKDTGLTTDQSIFGLSLNKKKLAESLFGAMKSAAVDCELNANENGDIACYRFATPTMEPLFNPNLSDDLRESAASTRMARK